MHADYLSASIEADKRNAAVEVAKKFVAETLKQDFDAIAVRGISGITFGSVLGYVFNKPVAVIRKALEGHSSYLVESPYQVKRYLIADDFVASGETLYNIVTAMKFAHPDAECVGMFCYRRDLECQGYPNGKAVLDHVEAYKKWNSGSASAIDAFIRKNI